MICHDNLNSVTIEPLNLKGNCKSHFVISDIPHKLQYRLGLQNSTATRKLCTLTRFRWHLKNMPVVCYRKITIQGEIANKNVTKYINRNREIRRLNDYSKVHYWNRTHPFTTSGWWKYNERKKFGSISDTWKVSQCMILMLDLIS